MEKMKQFGTNVAAFAMGFALIAIITVLIVIEGIILNPLVFGVILLLAPRLGAKMIKEDDPDDVITNFPIIFWWKINKTIWWWMLPWQSKSHLLLATKMKGATVQEEVKLFNSEHGYGLLTNKLLSRKALHQIWMQSQYCDFAVMLPYMGRLNFEEFRRMVKYDQLYLAVEYMETYTLSSEMLELLFSTGSIEARNVLEKHIKKNGLSAALLAKEKDIKQVDWLVIIDQALKVYNDCQMTKQSANSPLLWDAFLTSLCKNNERLSSEAQILMNPTQYRAYHLSHGGMLDEEAIIYFLSKQDATMQQSVIKYELIAHQLSTRIKHLLQANTNLMVWYLQA